MIQLMVVLWISEGLTFQDLEDLLIKNGTINENPEGKCLNISLRPLAQAHLVIRQPDDPKHRSSSTSEWLKSNETRLRLRSGLYQNPD